MTLHTIARALVALPLVLTTAHVSAGHSPPERTIHTAMVQVMADGVPGIVVLRRDGEEVIRMAIGLGNLSPQIPLAATDRMRVGSLVKTFVSVITLQLAEEGKLGLDDALQQYLPDAVPNSQDLKIRQLLNHTSGVFDYWQDETFFNALIADPTQVWAPETLVDLAAAHPLGVPGAAWAYSNTNYILLGSLIEAVTGRTLGTEMKERLFDRLHLDNTSFEVSPEMSVTFAHGYALLGDPVPVDVTGVDPSAAWAAGGSLVSTADDLAAFYAALMHGNLMSPERLDEMLATVPARDGLDYGLGIAEVTVSCGTAWGHQGEFPGYLSFALTSRDGERQAVVLVNFYSLSDAGHAAFDELVDLAFCGSAM